MIELKHINKIYNGFNALNDISLTIKDGEISTEINIPHSFPADKNNASALPAPLSPTHPSFCLMKQQVPWTRKQ